MTVASELSHLVVRPRLFYKINENKRKRKINIDLAVVASQMPGGAIHDRRSLNDHQGWPISYDSREKRSTIHCQ